MADDNVRQKGRRLEVTTGSATEGRVVGSALLRLLGTLLNQPCCGLSSPGGCGASHERHHGLLRPRQPRRGLERRHRLGMPAGRPGGGAVGVGTCAMASSLRGPIAAKRVAPVASGRPPHTPAQRSSPNTKQTRPLQNTHRLKAPSWLAISSSALASAREAGGRAASGRSPPRARLLLLFTDACESMRGREGLLAL